MIPLMNLQRQMAGLNFDLETAFRRVLGQCQFIQGPEVVAFERDFSRLCGAGYGVGCSSGTSAILLALEALGIGPGDEVITSTHTFIATIEAIIGVGARPVLVDVEPNCPNLDLEKVKEAIGPRTRAIVPVHMYGYPVNMPDLMAIAKERDLFVIEDCSQAHLAEVAGRRVGTFGDAGAFSLFPSKNLGALGDSGIVVTEDADLASKMKKIADHGRIDKYYHDTLGFNYRMGNLQAAFLNVKLPHLEEWTSRRREVALKYRETLGELGAELLFFEEAPNAKAVFHLFVVRLKDRNGVLKGLQSNGIQAGVHYPVPCHLQPALKSLGYGKGSFPIAERMSEEVISLPICESINDQEVKKICETLVDLLGGNF
jgi:dTDP-4-amino-4,6-dideoxygalactose transaminase